MQSEGFLPNPLVSIMDPPSPVTMFTSIVGSCAIKIDNVIP